MTVINASYVQPEVVPSERVIPVWLSLNDLEVVERALQLIAATAETDPALQQQVADLQKHFDWVRSEFVTT
jgi:hypothetical protein